MFKCPFWMRTNPCWPSFPSDGGVIVFMIWKCADHYWPFVRGTNGNQWFPLTKGQYSRHYWLLWFSPNCWKNKLPVFCVAMTLIWRQWEGAYYFLRPKSVIVIICGFFVTSPNLKTQPLRVTVRVNRREVLVHQTCIFDLVFLSFFLSWHFNFMLL